MLTHDIPVASPNSSPAPLSLSEQYDKLRQLRSELLLKYRPVLQEGAGPIRVMARMVADLQKYCQELEISPDIRQQEIVNRTIGDVNLRTITECEGKPGGPGDYRMLAEELGIALPGENINGYIAPGETYLWIREQMLECERLLLANNIDVRIYDILATGNAVLRSWLAEEMQQWNLPASTDRVYLGLGAMDSINRVFCGLAQIFREDKVENPAVLFPSPGFQVPEWQARSYGYRRHYYRTLAENHFKMTAAELEETLTAQPDIRVIYLTVTNNPTTFAYTPTELDALHGVLRHFRELGREVYILADLAYIGTGKPAEDQARMATFAEADVFNSTIFISSFSKTYTLTGDRFAWVTIGNPSLAIRMACGWSNGIASMPAEWQLRFMVYVRLLRSRPWLSAKLRAFYRMRRRRFIEQLRRIDAEQRLFAHIYIDDDATVYNWSKLLPGEDAFTLFEKTGIAGVPGSGFGYSDDYVRFSIGTIPVPES